MLQPAEDVGAMPDLNVVAVHVLLRMLQRSGMAIGFKIMPENDMVVLVERTLGTLTSTLCPSD